MLPHSSTVGALFSAGKTTLLEGIRFSFGGSNLYPADMDFLNKKRNLKLGTNLHDLQKKNARLVTFAEGANVEDGSFEFDVERLKLLQGGDTTSMTVRGTSEKIPTQLRFLTVLSNNNALSLIRATPELMGTVDFVTFPVDFGASASQGSSWVNTAKLQDTWTPLRRSAMVRYVLSQLTEKECSEEVRLGTQSILRPPPSETHQRKEFFQSLFLFGLEHAGEDEYLFNCDIQSLVEKHQDEKWKWDGQRRDLSLLKDLGAVTKGAGKIRGHPGLAPLDLRKQNTERSSNTKPALYRIKCKPPYCD